MCPNIHGVQSSHGLQDHLASAAKQNRHGDDLKEESANQMALLPLFTWLRLSVHTFQQFPGKLQKVSGKKLARYYSDVPKFQGEAVVKASGFLISF